MSGGRTIPEDELWQVRSGRFPVCLSVIVVLLVNNAGFNYFPSCGTIVKKESMPSKDKSVCTANPTGKCARLQPFRRNPEEGLNLN